MKGNNPYLVVILIQAIYAAMFLLSKAAFDHGMNNFIFVFYRQAAATIFLIPFAFFFEWYAQHNLHQHILHGYGSNYPSSISFSQFNHAIFLFWNQENCTPFAFRGLLQDLFSFFLGVCPNIQYFNWLDPIKVEECTDSLIKLARFNFTLYISIEIWFTWCYCLTFFSFFYKFQDHC